MGINLSQHNIGIVATPPRQVESQTHDKGAFCHFYDVRDTQGKPEKDYPDYYKILLSQAEQVIRIWDPYFHETEDCEVFKAVTASKIDILIVTSLDKKYRCQNVQSMSDYCNNIEKNLPANVRNATIKMRAYERNDWHDRFLVVDDRYFLVGASVNNQLKNNWSHGIYEVTNPKDKALIKSKFDIYFGCTVNSHRKTVQRVEPQT